MQAFARKLGLTAAVLRCATRKELCARFRATNPQTEFDLERSFKWMQGKSLPRSPSVYDDWAAVLGSARPGGWLAASSVEAFTDEIATLFSVDRAELQALADQFLGAVLTRQLADDGLAGTYLCYSLAWSPYHVGQLVRGIMELQPGTRRGLLATYTENLPGGAWTARGEARRSGRVLWATFEGVSEEHVSLSLLVPGRPISVLAGRMQGSTLHGAGTQLCTTRIVLLRTQPGQAAMADAFVAAEATVLASDMALHGLPKGCASGMATAVLKFLLSEGGGTTDPMTPADLAGLLAITLRE